MARTILKAQALQSRKRAEVDLKVEARLSVGSVQLFCVVVVGAMRFGGIDHSILPFR